MPSRCYAANHACVPKDEDAWAALALLELERSLDCGLLGRRSFEKCAAAAMASPRGAAPWQAPMASPHGKPPWQAPLARDHATPITT